MIFNGGRLICRRLWDERQVGTGVLVGGERDLVVRQAVTEREIKKHLTYLLTVLTVTRQ